MTYSQTLDYLFTKLPLFSRIGAAAYKKDLTNTLKLCDAVDNPQKKIKTIHIAGTNGKGSVSHMLASIFQECGYVTGLYTSPHLKDFRERIKINGEFISEKEVTDFVEIIKPEAEKVEPSFFELTVVMALDHFKNKNVDVAIIETGLGGRLDSTNVIDPLLSIITNIGYDHMNILGDTLGEIAYEKAGIIKTKKPVVIGETLKETKNIFIEKASQTGSEIYFARDEFEILDLHTMECRLEADIKHVETNIINHYSLDLPGLYQAKNLITVLSAIRHLNKSYNLPHEKVKAALSSVIKNTGLHGRWEIIGREPLVVLDVAHNEDGIRQLVSQITANSFGNIHIIFGIVKDKEVDRVLSLLPPDAKYYFTKANIPRALPEDQLAQRAADHGLHGLSFQDVNAALNEAKKNAGPKDLILVCGSVFVVGEVIVN